MSVLGLELEEEPPANWTPLEVIVIAKCLDADGSVTMFHTASPTLTTHEAIGLMRWTELTLERGLMEDDD